MIAWIKANNATAEMVAAEFVLAPSTAKNYVRCARREDGIIPMRRRIVKRKAA